MPSFLVVTSLAAVLLGTFCSVASAQQGPGIAPGEYLTGDGWGTLNVRPSGKFTLETSGANGHTCSFEGTIRRGRAKIDCEIADETCVLVFKPTAKGVAVSGESQGVSGCLMNCGARASFEGEYLKPAPGCTTSAVAGTRRRFSALYAAKDYAQAAALLRSLLGQCAATNDWYESWAMRNDLAITEYHLQQYAACLETLRPVIERAHDTDEELSASVVAPVDVERSLPLARATRYNAKLCRQGTH